MAPYVHSNHLPNPSRTSAPLFLYNLPARRSFDATVFAVAPSPTDRPFEGIGPLILQPSPSNPVAAETSDFANGHDSPRLAFLAILAIPLVGGLIVFLVLRRRRQQKPAKRPALASLGLRSEAARARTDVESPRMQQLPRDRIRAMNSVTRDNETRLSISSDYQIFSPRPPSPPPNELPRPQGNFLLALSVPGSPVPSSYSTMSTTSSANLTSCPPTPCTPTFVVSTVLPSVAEVDTDSDGNESEESRFTWDFRCKGMANRRSRAVLGPVLDISHANNVTIKSEERVEPSAETAILISVKEPEKAPSMNEEAKNVGRLDVNPVRSVDFVAPPASEGRDDKGTLAVPCLVPEAKENIPNSALQDAPAAADSTGPANTDDSIPITEVVNSAEQGPPPTDTETSSLNGNDSLIPKSLTVLDLKLDVTSFSSEVVKALSGSSDCELVRNPSTDKVASPNEGNLCTPPKTPKKRLVLSKPNHRTLTPSSPSLKIHTQSTASLLADLDLPVRSPSQVLTGRQRASSDSKVELLRNSSSLGAFVTVRTPVVETFQLPEPVSGQDATEARLNAVQWAEGVLLRSSLSMPISIELSRLQSTPTTIKTKEK